MGVFKDSNKGRPRYQSYKEMKAYSTFEFNNFVEQRQDKHWYLKETNKRLISFSSLMNIADMNIYKENEYINNRKNLGKSLMDNLKFCFEQKNTDINNFLIPEIQKKHLDAVLKAFSKHNIKIIGVEHLVCNDSFIGFVDVIVKYQHKTKTYFCNCEIKLRNSLKQTVRDRMQVWMYHTLNTLPPIILIVNDFGDYSLDLSYFTDRMKWPGIKPKLTGIVRQYNNYLKEMGEQEWTLNPWKIAY